VMSTVSVSLRYSSAATMRQSAKDVKAIDWPVAYDASGRLAEATGPDGTRLSIARDQYGFVRSESMDGRELLYHYDELGRRVGRTTPTGATTTWSYDAAGRRTGLVASGRSVDISYDAAGREVKDPVRGQPVFQLLDEPYRAWSRRYVTRFRRAAHGCPASCPLPGAACCRGS
jgi:YD repeat-containing protein